mgnify:CR=1 FL=1
MKGYYNNPEATQRVLRDGWLHTGDMGYMRDAEMLYVVGRFKSLLIAADGEKYSPEGIEENLVESSKYIDGAILHNSQDPYTIALITPNKEALKAYAKELGLDPASEEAKVQMLEKISGLTSEEAKTHPNRNIITRAVGILPQIDSEYNQVELNGGILLSCTDGLSGMLSAEQIQEITLVNKLDEVPDRLIVAANDLQSNDNVTATVVAE